MGGLLDHARTELDRTGNDDEFNECILKAIEGFLAFGHSGGSASVGIHILNELLQFKNLTPLTNDPHEWNEVGTRMYQSARNPEAFSEDGGRTYYLLSEDNRNEVGAELIRTFYRTEDHI